MYSFQVDSKIIQQAYKSLDNYKIIENSSYSNSKIVAIYFSSNGIYFPNKEDIFKETILKKNRFEWEQNLIDAQKHILIRDIRKQWYLGGINYKIDTIDKILNFLQEECKGFEIITIGSSAGGFAAVLFGILLNANKMFSFSGQFDLTYLLDSSNEAVNPIIFRSRYNNEISKWFDLREMMLRHDKCTAINYIVSNNSDIDSIQINHVKDILSINKIQVMSNIHGVSLRPYILQTLIELDKIKLKLLSEKKWLPSKLAIKLLGFTLFLEKETKWVFRKIIKKIKLIGGNKWQILKR